MEPGVEVWGAEDGAGMAGRGSMAPVGERGGVSDVGRVDFSAALPLPLCVALTT